MVMPGLVAASAPCAWDILVQPEAVAIATLPCLPMKKAAFSTRQLLVRMRRLRSLEVHQWLERIMEHLEEDMPLFRIKNELVGRITHQTARREVQVFVNAST